MNTFYIASSFANIDTVRHVRNQLIKRALFIHMIGLKMRGLQRLKI